MASPTRDGGRPNEESARRYLTYAALGIGTYVGYKVLFGGKSTNEHGFQYEPDQSDEVAEYPNPGKYWVSNPWDKRPILLSKSGLASLPPVTLFKVIDDCVAAGPDEIQFKWESQDEKTEEWEWHSLSRAQYRDNCKSAARAMIALGLQQWEAVSILGFNHICWFTSGFGAMYAGGLMAGQYTTNNPGQVKYIANHSKTRIAFCEDLKQAAKFVSEIADLPLLSVIVVWKEDVTDEIRSQLSANLEAGGEDCSSRTVQILDWSEFIKFGNPVDRDKFDALDAEQRKRQESIEPEQCCTLIYTSGTTGPPKAVMCSHDNVVFDTRTVFESNDHLQWEGEQATVSYLPLSHIAGQLADFVMPLYMNAYKKSLCTVHIARPSALKGTLVDTLKAARPTVFLGVPRVWEKIEEKMKSVGANNTGIKKMIGDWAKSKGLQGLRARSLGGSGYYPDGYNIAKKLVFDNVARALGFDRLLLGVTGAAPIKRSTIDYFGSLGIQLVEVYGMSETTGCHTLGRSYHNKVGSIGLTMRSLETVIIHDASRDRPGEGEICMRGRHVMMGYMYDPEKTKGAIDSEGLLHSGDVGRKDEDDLVFITGRIKELIITAGGENIAPVPIEDYIKTLCPGISNFTVIGDKKKYLTALVCLRLVQNLDTQEFGSELATFAKDVNPAVTTIEQAQTDDVWKQYIQNAIDTYNNDKQVCVSRAQKIQYFTILDSDFGVDSGELTSTMKLKRSVIHTKYATQIDSMYQ